MTTAPRHPLCELPRTGAKVQIPMLAITHAVPLRPNPSAVELNGKPLRPLKHQLTDAELPHKTFRYQNVTAGIPAPTHATQKRVHSRADQNDPPPVAVPINMGVIHRLGHPLGVPLQPRVDPQRLELDTERHIRVSPGLRVAWPKHRIDAQPRTRTIRAEHLALNQEPRFKASQHPISQFRFRSESIKRVLRVVRPLTSTTRKLHEGIRLTRERPKSPYPVAGFRIVTTRHRVVHPASLSNPVHAGHSRSETGLTITSGPKNDTRRPRTLTARPTQQPTRETQP